MSQRPIFNANRREVYDNTGKMLYKTTTYLFRDDLNWHNFIKFLDSKYKDAEKVNIIVHCCSNGPEAYSCAASLINKLGDESKKFFPILARDINSENIRHAKQFGSMGLSEYDLYCANYYLNDNIGSYFNFVPPKSGDYSIAIVPKNKLKEKIHFEQGDIFKDLETIPNKNTVLMCRNFWPYLSYKKRIELAQKLSEKFDDTSLVVIGDFDRYNGAIDELLSDNGFMGTYLKNVFIKR